MPWWLRWWQPRTDHGKRAADHDLIARRGLCSAPDRVVNLSRNLEDGLYPYILYSSYVVYLKL